MIHVFHILRALHVSKIVSTVSVKNGADIQQYIKGVNIELATFKIGCF